MSRRDRRRFVLLGLAGSTMRALLVVILGTLQSAGPERAEPTLPEVSGGGSVSASASPGGAEPSGSPDDETVEGAGGTDAGLLATIPNRIELYAGSVSVIPGQAITLHVSTKARTYGYSVERLDATLRRGGEITATMTGREGQDYRSFMTFDPLTREVRANWPVTDTLHTKGWKPGVYIVTARDSAGTVGRAVFVVRTATLVRSEPCFVFSALTYQAYNFWGGANLYGYAGPPAVEVGFDRPYLRDDGLGFWSHATESRSDDRILAWLQVHRLRLQYTTDYDLSIASPGVAPRLLILGRHTEYVGERMRDWVEEHVNSIGDMNVLNFGANSFYWRVRLIAAGPADAPLDVVCYRQASADPVAASDPGDVTVRWRDAPINRPEGAVLGAQYVAVLDHGTARFSLTVTSAMPAALLAGTGWRPGTVLHNLLRGEADLVYPGVGGVAIMDGAAVNQQDLPVTTSVTIRVSPAGARVFDAGTFAWGDGFEPSPIDLGVPASSFEVFNRNLLVWLGFPTPG